MSYYRSQGSNGIPPVLKNLIIINVLVFLAQLVFDNNYQLTDKLALHPLDKSPYVDNVTFKPYQLFTHLFTHGGFTHLLFNMIGLYVFGNVLENLWGGKRFLFCYLLSGLGAAALHLAVQHFRFEHYGTMVDTARGARLYMASLAPSVGASGAVMGILAAFAYLFPNTPMLIFPIPFPIKMVYLALIYVGIDLFGGLAQSAGDNIAHFAHLGGAITGFILVLLWNKTNKKTFY